jgi:hypothetical protein
VIQEPHPRFLRLDDDSVLYDSPLNEEGLKQVRQGVPAQRR